MNSVRDFSCFNFSLPVLIKKNLKKNTFLLGNAHSTYVLTAFIYVLLLTFQISHTILIFLMKQCLRCKILRGWFMP